jgi:glucose/arabinose dehydrogenase
VTLNPLKTTLLLSFILLSVCQWSRANTVFQENTENGSVLVQQLAAGLGVPWGMAFISSNEILFTQRNGGLGIVAINTGKVTKLPSAPNVMVGGQGGLLDVAVPANYKAGGWLYFTYVKNMNNQGVTALARAKIENKKMTNWQDIFVSRSGTDTSRHFGSRIAFDGKGHIFFTIGDRGERHSAQDLITHNGTVLRLNLDGSIPTDNPFYANNKAFAAIWSYGHRNPQGIVFDKTTDRLWAIEHGPRGGDEINLILPGRNYGWPIISYGKEYWGPLSVGEGTHKQDMEQPHKTYIPSIAPGSLLLYKGDVFTNWQGSLFAGALKLTHINRVTVGAKGQLKSEERLLNKFAERIRALLEGPDGYIYFSTDSGKILRLVPQE